MNQHDATDILIHTLKQLPIQRIKQLQEHASNQTPILCATPLAHDYFVHNYIADPFILAHFKYTYPQQNAQFYDLHKQLQNEYLRITNNTNHTDYTLALTNITQYQLRNIILTRLITN